MDTKMVQDCLKICNDCAAQCDALMSGTPDQAAIDACAKLCADCAKMCADCAKMLDGTNSKFLNAARKAAGLAV